MDIKRSKLTKKQKLKLIEHFAAGTTARTTAGLVGVNKNTAALFFHKLRLLITKNQEAEVSFQGEVEVDESYFRINKSS